MRLLARVVRRIPYAAWIIAPFALSYFLFFVGPVFLQSGAMQFFEYLPAGPHIGGDLEMAAGWQGYWFTANPTEPPASGEVPPLVALLRVLVLALGQPAAYALVTWCTILLYLWTALVLPLQVFKDERHLYIPLLVATTGLMSYGLHFELERGQWNVLASALALLAVWLFHHHGRLRFVAYALFTASVHMKLFPILLLPLFVTDWRDWRRNAVRGAALTGAILLPFLVRGPGPLRIGIEGLRTWVQQPIVWVGNPSISSGVTIILDAAAWHGSPGLMPFRVLLEWLLAAGLALCLALIVRRAWRAGRTGLDVHYLLAATAAGILLMSGGHDYRLAVLGAPIALLLMHEASRAADTDATPGDLVHRPAILVLALAYSITLFSPVQKPFFIANSFPLLFVIVLATTHMALTQPTAEGGSKYGDGR